MAEDTPPDVTPDVTPDATASDEDTTEGLLRQLLAEQRAHRAEVAELRDQINRGRQQPPRPSATVLSQEELARQRADEIAEHEFYCPACGRLYDRPRECTGRPEAPHDPVEVVSTDELKQDDESKHTAAPGVAP